MYPTVWGFIIPWVKINWTILTCLNKHKELFIGHLSRTYGRTLIVIFFSESRSFFICFIFLIIAYITKLQFEKAKTRVISDWSGIQVWNGYERFFHVKNIRYKYGLKDRPHLNLINQSYKREIIIINKKQRKITRLSINRIYWKLLNSLKVSRVIINKRMFYNNNNDFFT